MYCGQFRCVTCSLQVSRIFIANILRARAAVANRQRADLIDDTYLLTSDADIWPIYGDVYRLPAGHDVISLNSECCGAFSHRNVAYRMLPMANVGMRVRTWRRLTRRYYTLCTSQFTLRLLVHSVACRNLHISVGTCDDLLRRLAHSESALSPSLVQRHGTLYPLIYGLFQTSPILKTS